MEKIADANKMDLENNSYDEEELKHLWIQTYAYRQEFIRNNTTQDIVTRFPAYSDPSRVMIYFNQVLSDFEFRL
jgi:hypothetical protein